MEGPKKNEPWPALSSDELKSLKGSLSSRYGTKDEITGRLNDLRKNLGSLPTAVRMENNQERRILQELLNSKFRDDREVGDETLEESIASSEVAEKEYIRKMEEQERNDERLENYYRKVEGSKVPLTEYQEGEIPTVEGGFEAHAENEKGVLRKIEKKERSKAIKKKITNTAKGAVLDIGEIVENRLGKISEYPENDTPSRKEIHEETLENREWGQRDLENNPEAVLLSAEEFQELRDEYKTNVGYYRQLKKAYTDPNHKGEIRKELNSLSEKINEISSKRRKYSLLKLMSNYDGAEDKLGEKALRHFEAQKKVGVEDISAAGEFFKAAGVKLSESKLTSWYMKLPGSARITLSALAGAAVTGGGVGTFASRLAGGVAGFLVGKSVGELSRELLKRNTEGTRQSYTKEISSKKGSDMSVDDLEKLLSKRMSSLNRQEKREMALSAGLTFSSALFTGSTIRDSGVGDVLFDKYSTDNTSVAGESVGDIGSSAESLNIESVEVAASDRGAIQTFVNLKDSLEVEYPNQATQPQIVKDILAMRAIDLAEKYGFYTPDQVKESSMLLAGEKLGISHDGKLEYIKTNGEKITLEGDGDFSTREGAWGEKGGTMFDYDGVKEVSDSIKSNPELINRQYLETCESLEGFVGCDMREGDIVKSTFFNEGKVIAHLERLVLDGKLNEGDLLRKIYDASSAYDWKTKWDVLNAKPGQPIEIEVSELAGSLSKFFGISVTESEIRSVMPDGEPVYYSEESTIKLIDLYAEGKLTKDAVLREISGGLNIEKISHEQYPRVNPEVANMMVDQRNVLVDDLNKAIAEGNNAEEARLRELVSKLDQEMTDLNKSDTPVYGEQRTLEGFINNKFDEINELLRNTNSMTKEELGAEFKERSFSIPILEIEWPQEKLAEYNKLVLELGNRYFNYDDYNPNNPSSSGTEGLPVSEGGIKTLDSSNIVENPREVIDTMHEIKRASRDFQGMEAFKNSGLMPELNFDDFKKVEYHRGGFHGHADNHVLRLFTESGDTVRIIVSEDGKRVFFDGKSLLGGNYPNTNLNEWNPLRTSDSKELYKGLPLTGENIKNMTEFINNQATIKDSFEKYQSMDKINPDPEIINSPRNGFLNLSEIDRNFVAKEMFKDISNDPSVSGLNWGSPLAAIIESGMTADELVSLMKENNLGSMELSAFAKEHQLTQGNEFMTLMIYADYFKEMIIGGEIEKNTKISSLF